MKYERIAIISDIHGNITALNAVLNDIKNKNIDKIFNIGDCVVKGANPDLVIDTIKEKCEVNLLGNCDYVICKPESKKKNFWTRNKIGEERAKYISKLPISYDFYMSGHLIRIFHSSPHRLDAIFNPMFSNEGTTYSGTEIKNPELLFKNTKFIGKSKKDKEPDIVGFGHSHTPCLLRFKNKMLFNPGSVGFPVEMLNKYENDKSNKFSTFASYIIIEGVYNSKKLCSISFNFVRVPYDIEKEVKMIEKSDIPNKDVLIRSLRTAMPNNLPTNKE